MSVEAANEDIHDLNSFDEVEVDTERTLHEEILDEEVVVQEDNLDVRIADHKVKEDRDDRKEDKVVLGVVV